MKLHNTLTRYTDTIKPLRGNALRIYTCGPTVYNHAHIGNLSSFIYADTLRRTAKLAGYDVQHVINYTDVDDKTIRRSREMYPSEDPFVALNKLTENYIDIFMNDMKAIGNDTTPVTFLRATDHVAHMQRLIASLHDQGFAYITEDGVYFSIEAYKKSGKTYGQLLEINSENTSKTRIENDEYDKDNVHDFALWKTRKDNEPYWDFTIDDHDLSGRPGWHIECSAMSEEGLGIPFDIHTGGIDLIFPHHENEIAQSTAGHDNLTMAAVFMHSNHMLVEGKRMAKSAQNFYTVQNIIEEGFEPLAFRLLVLQSHYKNEAHFSWESLMAAQSRLQSLRAMADQRFQTRKTGIDTATIDQAVAAVKQALLDDLNTPLALTELSTLTDAIDNSGISTANQDSFTEALQLIDSALGLQLTMSTDITDRQKGLIAQREAARSAKDWATSDTLRNQLSAEGIGLNDTPHGTIWYRV